MPVPGVAPLMIPDLACPLCSQIMDKKIISNSNSTFSHMLYGCQKCGYSYHHRPDHARGDFRGIGEFLVAQNALTTKEL